MINFIILCFIIYFIFYNFPVLNDFLDYIFNWDLYLLIFIFIFTINFLFLNLKIKYNFNKDILIKFYNLFFKNPSFFLNYIINTFKKIYLFFIHFKYFKEKKMISNFFKKLNNLFFIFWRPLFKKFSYFGFYRSNRSKWIK